MASEHPSQPPVKTISHLLVTRGPREGTQDAARIGHAIALAPDKLLLSTDLEKYLLLEQKMQGLTVLRDGKRVPHGITAESIIQTHNLLKDLQDSGQFGGFRILCDGMGGESEGHIAANMAIAIIQKEILTAVLKNKVTAEGLTQAIETANDALLEYSYTHSVQTGTTVAATLTDSVGMTHCASFGDTRMFLRRTGGNVRQINLEESRVTQKILEGTILPSQTFSDGERNLTEGLPAGMPSIHVESIRLNPGEQIIMTTDGVWEAITNNNNPALNRIIHFYFLAADKMFADLLASGKEHPDALKEVNGWLFQKINLYGVAKDAKAEEVLAHLTRQAVGEASGDNASAIIVEAASSEGVKEPLEYFQAGYRFYTLDKTGAPVEAQVCGYDQTSGSMVVKMKKNGVETWEIVPAETVAGYKSINPPEKAPIFTDARTWKELEAAIDKYRGFFKRVTNPDGTLRTIFISYSDMRGALAGLKDISSPETTLRGRLEAIPPGARARALDLMKGDAAKRYYLFEDLVRLQPVA